MNLSLVPTLSGRPAIVKVAGTTLFVSLHDRGFLEEASRLYQVMLSKHPDKPIIKSLGGINGTRRVLLPSSEKRKEGRYLEAVSKLAHFLARERDGYYKIVGIEPPNWTRWSRWAVEGKVLPSSRPGSAEQSVKALLDLQTGG